VKTEFVIQRGGSIRLIAALGELWTYRTIIVAFAERNIRVKHKQATLVIAWAVLAPSLSCNASRRYLISGQTTEDIIARQ
jgi:hypothetical protein